MSSADAGAKQVSSTFRLSGTYVDVAMTEDGAGGARGVPHFVERNNEISDDVALRIDGCEAHLRRCMIGMCGEESLAILTPQYPIVRADGVVLEADNVA